MSGKAREVLASAWFVASLVGGCLLMLDLLWRGVLP